MPDQRVGTEVWVIALIIVGGLLGGVLLCVCGSALSEREEEQRRKDEEEQQLRRLQAEAEQQRRRQEQEEQQAARIVALEQADRQAEADHFIQAAGSGRLADLEALYRAGGRLVGPALLECTNGVGRTTGLMWAAANGHEDCVRALLDWGAAVNKANSDGNTALHCAAKRGALECVRLLVERGADQGLRNTQGEAALEVAQKALLAPGEQVLSVSTSRDLEKAFGSARQGRVAGAGEPEPEVEPLMAVPVMAVAIDDLSSGSGAPEEPRSAPATLEELAAMAQIDVGSISAFTESDFDELTTGLGIEVGPRIVLRTQFRAVKSGAGAEPEPELDLESAFIRPPGSVGP